MGSRECRSARFLVGADLYDDLPAVPCIWGVDISRLYFL